jgi:TP901 family phage tail tape measure protein
MADQIRGLKIKFGADMTEVVTGINKLTANSGKAAAELRQVEKALKLDPKNVTLLTQKAQILAKQTETLRDKQEKLKQALENVNDRIMAGEKIEPELYRKLQRDVERTTQELKKYDDMASKMKTAHPLMDMVNNKAVSAALASMGAGFVKLTKDALQEAIKFETAFAGVEKTVNGTKEQLAGLREGIINMARELPSSREEIAEVAAAAGQLGIKTGDILEFTKVMINLGETTNLTSADAASQLARFANITGMSADNFTRLGSTLVDLGNNMATTEAEIADMGLRLAGAGAQAGLTEDQILAMAAALSSVGITADAGGSAMSKFLIQMQTAVETGNADLEKFARTAGLSSEEFKKLFSLDAASAVDAFVQGMGRIEESGGSVIGVLEGLGITEVRMRDALLRLSGAGDLLNSSLAMGGEAWENNSALAKEAAVRYETTAAQMEMLKNQASEVLLRLGEGMIPTLQSLLGIVGPVAGGISALAKAFAELPAPLQILVGFLAVLPSLIGTVNTAKTALNLFRSGLLGVQVQAGATGIAIQSMLGPIGKIAGIVALAGTVLLGLAASLDAGKVSAADLNEQVSGLKSKLDEAAGSISSGQSELEKLTKEMRKNQAAMLTLEEGSDKYTAAQSRMELLKKRLIELTGDEGTASNMLAAVMAGDSAAMVKAEEALMQAYNLKTQAVIENSIAEVENHKKWLESEKVNLAAEINMLQATVNAYNEAALAKARFSMGDLTMNAIVLQGGDEAAAQMKKLEESLGWFDEAIKEDDANMTKFLLQLDAVKTSGAYAEEAMEDFAGAARGAGSASARSAKETEKQVTQMERYAHQMEQVTKKYETLAKNAENAGGKEEALALRTAGLREKIALQAQATALAEEQLAEGAAGTEAAVMNLEKALASEKGTLADLEGQLLAAEAAQAAFTKEVETTGESAGQLVKDMDGLYDDLVKNLDAARKEYDENVDAAKAAHTQSVTKYKEDLASAIEEINKRLIAEEEALTKQYEQELAARVRAIRDFAGIFDEVTQKEVSGEQLLSNLKGQLETLEDWQKNLDALRERSLDSELLKELTDMGPSAAAEISALNALTDEQLTEYAEIFKKKNELAKKEAVYQMEDQRLQIEEQLAQLRENAAAQIEEMNRNAKEELDKMNKTHEEALALMKEDWDKSMGEIRKTAVAEMDNIETKMEQLCDKAAGYGAGFMDNYIAGINSKRAQLEEVLAGLEQTSASIGGGQAYNLKVTSSGGRASSPYTAISPAEVTAAHVEAVAPGLLSSISAAAPEALAAINAPELLARYDSTINIVSAYTSRAREAARVKAGEVKQTDVNITQNNYSPEPIDAREVYRYNQELLRTLGRSIGF